MGSLDDLVHVMRPPAAEPEGALILLHGRGADEHDLQPVLDALDPQRRLWGVTPGAPLRGPGIPGAHWYAVQRIGYPEPETFHRTYPLLTGWLDAFAEHTGIPMGRTVLGGFSQGTVMSYASGLGKGRPRPAGILAISGFMPTVEGFELDLSGLEGYPVMIEHGTRDPMIGVEWGRHARDRLIAAGADVEYSEHPGAHHIDPRRVPEMERWMQKRPRDSGRRNVIEKA